MSQIIGKISLAILLLVLTPKLISAQKFWTLQECIDYAVTNNLNLKKSTLQNEINKERYQQTKRNILPSASFGTGSSFNFGKSVDPNTNDYVINTFFSANYRLSSSVDLFRGFSKLNQISYNKLNYLAGIEDDKREKNDVAFQVMDTYYNVLFYKGLLGIAREQKEVSELSLKQAQAMVEAGLKAKSDLLEMQSRMAEEEVFVVQSLNSLNASLLQLQQLMNYAGSENFVIDYNDPSLYVNEGESIEKDSVFTMARRYNPLVKGEILRKQAAEKYLSITRGGLYPYLGLYGSYSSNYSALVGGDNITSLNDQFKNNASQYVGLSVNIPIFNKLSNRSDVKIAKLNLEQAKTDYALILQQINQEIEKNFQDLFAFSSEYEQMVSQLSAATLAFEAASKKLEQGLIDAIDFYNSKNLMAQAQSNVLRTKLQYELKNRAIDFFMGVPIYTKNTSK